MKNIFQAIFTTIFACLVSQCGWATGMPGINSQIAGQISRATSDAITKRLTDAIFIPTLKVKNASGPAKSFGMSRDERLVALIHDDGSVRVWDLKQGVQRPMIKAPRDSFTSVACASRADLVLLGNTDGSIGLYEVVTGKLSNRLASGFGPVVSLNLSQDEAFLVSGHESGQIVVWNLVNLRQETQIATPHRGRLRQALIQADNKKLIVATENGPVEQWDVASGQKLLSLAEQSEGIQGIWMNKTASRIVSLSENGDIQSSDIADPENPQQHSIDDFTAFTMNDDMTRAAFASEDGFIEILDASDFSSTSRIESAERITQLQFIKQGKLILGSDERGIVHVWQVSTGTEALKLISTESGWTVVDDVGRFDSSEAGMPNVSWEAGEQDIPLDNFSRKYYEPGLLATALENESFINGGAKPISQGINLPPEVNVRLSDQQKVSGTEYKVFAEILGSGNEDFGFYHNGKILDRGHLAQSKQSEADNRIRNDLEFRVDPVQGQNTFKLVASNQMGIEAKSNEVSVEFSGEKPATTTLNIFTIGINRYQDKELNLDFGVADAESIAKILGDERLGAFDKIAAYRLYDEQATKFGIIAELNRLSGLPQNDVFVLYLAGHGIAVNGEWYFLPHETTLQANESYYAQVGISAKELQELFTHYKMQRLLILIDSCYSGTGIAAFRSLQNSQRHFSRDLSKTVGLVVLAATRQDQEAAELTDLGHGLFTYIVAQGLEGQADRSPRNQKISAHEIAEFSTQEIPSFSKKYLGASQEPTAFTMGADFDLLNR